jgi:Ni/Co efflux regulator RcnB
MRRLLISAAALVILAVPALAQPDNNDRGEKSHGAPQAQDRGQAGPPQQNQAAPQQQRSGPPDRGHDDRGDNRSAVRQAAPVLQPQAAAPQRVPQDRGDRGRNAWQGQSDDRRGDRRALQQTAPVAQPQATTQNRGDRGNANFTNRPGGQNFGNRPGGALGNSGPRRDFSSFRDFHRSFNAPHRFRGPDYRRPNGWYDHRWSFGEFLPSLFWGSSYWLTDYYRYDLPPPPYGAVWVRDGYDALLIDRDSGEIITVEYDVFY